MGYSRTQEIYNNNNNNIIIIIILYIYILYTLKKVTQELLKITQDLSNFFQSIGFTYKRWAPIGATNESCNRNQLWLSAHPLRLEAGVLIKNIVQCFCTRDYILKG